MPPTSGAQISLHDQALDAMKKLDFFHVDPEFQKNEDMYEQVRKEILGDDSDAEVDEEDEEDEEDEAEGAAVCFDVRAVNNVAATGVLGNFLGLNAFDWRYPRGRQTRPRLGRGPRHGRGYEATPPSHRMDRLAHEWGQCCSGGAVGVTLFRSLNCWT